MEVQATWNALKKVDRNTQMEKYIGMEDRDRETILNLLYSHFDNPRYKIPVGMIINLELVKIKQIRNISQNNNLLSQTKPTYLIDCSSSICPIVPKLIKSK